MTLNELLNFVNSVRPGHAFTDAQLITWVNEVEAKIQTDIMLIDPIGIIQYSTAYNDGTTTLKDGNEKLLVPDAWAKLYRYFMYMMIDLSNGEIQRYSNSFQLFNEAYEEYAGWYASHIAPANGEAVRTGYYVSAYTFAVHAGYTGTEEEFAQALTKVNQAIGSAAAAAESASDAEAWAVGQRGGEDVPGTDETFHNNAKYYAQQARYSERTETGEKVTFNSGIDNAPIDSLVVNIQGCQYGDEGVYPSKTYKKKIVGYSAVTVYVQGAAGDPIPYTVDLPTNAGIVYSGTLDIVQGKLTVTSRLLTLTGEDGDGWVVPSTLASANRYARTRILADRTNMVRNSGFCSHYNNGSITGSNTTDQRYCVAVYDSSATPNRFEIRIRDLTYMSDGSATQATNSFISYLESQYSENRPVQIVYDLIDPVEYSVDAIPVPELAGVNKIYSDAGDVTVRYKYDPALEEDFCEEDFVSMDALRAKQSIDDLMQEFTPLETKPKSGSGDFVAGTTYKGLPYSSMAWAARDVLYEMSLESVFTAFRNPYSDLYAYDYNNESGSHPFPDSNPDPLKNDDSARTWAGAVCSTWVSWATNRPIRYTTDGILANLTAKTIRRVEDLEVGDAMYQKGHVALITGFKYKNGNVTKINVSEAWKPVFRSLWYTPEQWWTRYYDGGTKEHPGDAPFRVGRLPGNYNIRTLEPVHLVDNIITNKGDNVYFELGDDIWVYIKDGTQSPLYVIAPDGTSSEVSYTDNLSISQKYNGTTPLPLYNFKNILTSVGQWRIRDHDSRYDSRISIVNLDALSVSITENESNKTVVSLSGYNHSTAKETYGCKLDSYQVLRMHTSAEYTAEKPDWESWASWVYPIPTDLLPEQYQSTFIAANGSDDTTLHNTASSASFTINTSSWVSNHYSWYVRLYFETECGLAHKDTNAIIHIE